MLDSHREKTASPERTLRRLFLTLFLRGRGSRGLQKQTAPKSIARKLSWTLIFYALFGLLAVAFVGQPVFAVSVYLHSMTFVFLGMFIASSAGEILFNKEEADILLHRPIRPKELLWAKVRVLVEVSLWLATAFNLAGYFVGVRSGGWLFLPAHIVSTVLEAMFTTGCVVMAYELCLHWFGRERLDGFMTTAQVFISVSAVLAGQILPQLVMRFDQVGHLNKPPWWIGLLPPAWFAGLDDALAGSGSVGSMLLAVVGVAGTAIVLWLAFGRMAGDYETGLRALQETVSRRRGNRTGRRWIDDLIRVPPLRWWLRDPVERAAFLLSGAYLLRDREVKLRIYPGLAPFLVMPLVFLFPRHAGAAGGGSFGIAFGGAYLGLVPMLGLSMLQYSQQWQAADIFRVAPMAGPAPLCHGARRAVLCFLTLPVVVLFGLLTLFTQRDSLNLVLLLLPGIIAAPVFALIPGLSGAIPLSRPGDEAKAAGRGIAMMGVIVVCSGLAAISGLSWSMGFFWWLVVAETIVATGLYVCLRILLNRARWKSLE